MTETIEHKVLNIALHEEGNRCMNRIEFNAVAEKYHGKEGKATAIKLWKEGYLMINGWGYINPSRRGYVLLDKGIKTPKRQPTPQATTHQILDYLWRTKNAEFQDWLAHKNITQQRNFHIPDKRG